MIKLKIHSIVDVITNSSTVIYTYQNSTKEAKELIQEILKLSGETRNVDELFVFGEFYDDGDVYTGYLDDNDDINGYPVDYNAEWDYKEKDNWIESLIEKIMNGEIEKPSWMNDCYDGNDYDSYTPDIYLHIKAKDDKYNDLVKKVMNFLKSPSHEACYDG